MSNFEQIKDVYKEVRNCDTEIAQVIANGKDRIQQHGPNIVYLDMGLPGKVLESFTQYDDFVRWLAEINVSQSDSESGESDSHAMQEGSGDNDSDWEDVSTEGDSEDDDYEPAIPDAELKLSNKFSGCCDVFGREIRRYLPKAANYLLQYGQMYLQYATTNADENSKIDQKLNFLRAATLISAAIVRYKTLEHPQGYEDATLKLKSLHHSMLEQSASKTKSVDFVEFTNEIKAKIEKLRIDEGILLRYVHILRNRILETGKVCETIEKEIIAKIRGICESNSRKYTAVMTEIIEHCQQIMGTPPCKFAIAGLGSLAREEITLSSDFEHVIILDDAVTVTEDMREYYRWFTVIFHTVVIGLGETVVPSIDVKSLSDQYSSDALKKWYKDEYTPCGISFDGMMPHACKCPLGRQKPTKYRANVVELIQPASVMANYLTVEQDSENGYLLQDVLQTTAHVYGSREVYAAFLEKSAAIKKSFTPQRSFASKQELMQRISEAWNLTYNIAETYMNVKHTLYRPLTVMLHCMASVLGLTSNSSFNIIDEMSKRNIIDEECSHTLSHVLAVVLEMRMRCYRTKNRQRNIILDKDLPKLVSEKFVLDFRVAVIFLFDAIKDFFFNWLGPQSGIPMLLLPPRTSDYWQCFVEKESLHFRQNDAEYIEKMLVSVKRLIFEHHENAVAPGKTYFFLKTYVQLLSYTLRRFTKNNEHLSHDYGLLARHELREIYFWSRQQVLIFESNVSETVRSLVEESYMHYYDKEYDRANNRLDKAVALCDGNDIYDEDILDDLAVLEYELKATILRPVLATKYFSKRWPKQTTFYRASILRVGLAKSFFKRGNWREGKKVLNTLLEDVEKNSLKMAQTHYSSVMFLAGDVLNSFGNRSDADLLYERGNVPRDAKFAGEYPDSTDVFVDLLLADHYKYNFGTSRNVGRYSNFTYNSTHYRISLPLKMLYFRYFNALHVFSSETYGDMMSLILFALSEKDFNANLPAKHFAMWKHTQAIGFMTLCENIRFNQDIGTFENLLKDLSSRVITAKILQPFIYACLQEYARHPMADKNLLLKQNVVLQSTFQVLPDPIYLRALSKFRTFDFQDSVKLLWKLLLMKSRSEHDRNSSQKIVEFFLTSLLTVMITRKRHSPLPHLKKCREVSLKQSIWWEHSALDENHRRIMFTRLCKLSKLYIHSTQPYAVLHNFALDIEAYDERGTAVLLWKLIHARHLNRKFVCSSIFLLFETMHKLCHATLDFSYHNRQR